ncbi:MAG: hypothetical protein AAGH60_10610 [Pseudomonadota bacterium]
MATIVRGLVIRSIGYTLVLLGLIVLILPIPFGIPMIGAGTVLLVTNCPASRRLLRLARKRWRSADRLFEAIEKNVPQGVAKIVRKTRWRAVGLPAQRASITS